jgi:hypothetical protein
VNDIQNETIRAAVSNAMKKFPSDNGPVRFFLLLCPLCGTNFGDLHTRDQKVFEEIIAGRQVPLDDLCLATKNMNVFTNRLRAKNLLRERTEPISTALQPLIGQIVIPALGIKIQQCLDEGGLDEAKMFTNRAALWVALLSDKGNLAEAVQNLYQGLRQKEISVGAEIPKEREKDMNWKWWKKEVVCWTCKKSFPEDKIMGKIVIGAEGEQPFCADCLPVIVVHLLAANAMNNKRCLTINELYWVTELSEGRGTTTVKDIQNLPPRTPPANSIFYDSITILDGTPVLEFTCPLCTGKTVAAMGSKMYETGTASTYQLDFYNKQVDLYKRVPPSHSFSCPHCNGTVTVIK